MLAMRQCLGGRGQNVPGHDKPIRRSKFLFISELADIGLRPTDIANALSSMGPDKQSAVAIGRCRPNCL
ncbi:hypothetical protein DPM35_07705 [Mesorhizobium atlanticum]|uniref:Uncharacterized protein n=1 Tax=Mesorhizobium atlanticum TaxID=2233532 RepID=A0A330GZS5_9HYPH|nr:hypothetical protein DPM35_07705 [Mesorhizobium atlanticum]